MTESERIESIKQLGGRHLKDFKPDEITYEMCLIAVMQDGDALKYVPADLCTEEIYNTACRSNGYVLRYVPISYRTEELCEIAVNSYGCAIADVPEEYKTPELCLKAACQDPYAYNFIPVQYITVDFCVSVYDQKGTEALSNLPTEVRATTFYFHIFPGKTERQHFVKMLLQPWDILRWQMLLGKSRSCSAVFLLLF